MAIESNELRRYAVLGAEQRLQEIGDEARRIFAAFPELRAEGRGLDAAPAKAPAAPASRRGSTAASRRRTRRRVFSAAERRAISDRMTKYWAARRAAKKR